MKAHYKPDALVYQVGSWKDHSYWGPPELFPSDMERPSLYVRAPCWPDASDVVHTLSTASMIDIYIHTQDDQRHEPRVGHRRAGGCGHGGGLHGVRAQG